MTTTITARVQVPGLHSWPGAHEQRAYLRDPHRHLFHVSASLPAEHDERAVEWHDLADAILDAVNAASAPVAGVGVLSPRIGLRDFGAQSCEAIARSVHGYLVELGVNPCTVSVSEDGEFTATIERTTS